MNNKRLALRDLSSWVHEVKQEITAKIMSLPNNPAVKELGNHCFTISSKDLGLNWSAFYHDWKSQYEFLVDLIQNTPIEQVINVLHKIAYEKHFWSGRQHWIFNEKVCEGLKAIVKELEENND